MRLSAAVRLPASLLAVVLTLGVLSLNALTAPARADSLPYVPWSSVLPGWSGPFQPGSSNLCASGQPGCLDVTLAEQLRILNETGQACSHNALFPLAYVRMTQTYGWTRSQSGYYADVPYMNHMDAVFAKYYTDAYYNWTGGNTAAVPQAWQAAFNAGKNETVTGAGDLLLGMNAHINRDLPFVIADSGLLETDGTSGKADFDAVEQWLYDDTAPLFSEEAARFDSSMGTTNTALFNWWSFQAVSTWRENAWRNAEALASAPDAASRALIAANIENDANAMAATLTTTFAVTPLLTQSNAARDAYCALHKGAAAPVVYPMGMPTPWDNRIN
jgi:hypothetical protein